jgi:biotin transport system substrate-specific component
MTFARMEIAGAGTGTRTASWSWTEKGAVVVAGTLFLAVCSHVSLPLPWSLVPLNLQPFGVLLLALVLGPWMGAATAAAYLLEGMAGLPVFSPHGLGGAAQLFGPTGGYLMSYPLAAYVAGKLGAGKKFYAGLLGAVAGDAVVLLGGVAWLALISNNDWPTAFLLGVSPFLAGDFLKCVAAATLATALASWQTPKHDAPVR